MSHSADLGVPADLRSRLRHYRERAGLSREEAAALSGRGFRTLCVWETGARTPRLDQLRDLARVYGVRVVDLLAEDDHNAISGAA